MITKSHWSGRKQVSTRRKKGFKSQGTLGDRGVLHDRRESETEECQKPGLYSERNDC